MVPAPHPRTCRHAPSRRRVVVRTAQPFDLLPAALPVDGSRGCRRSSRSTASGRSGAQVRRQQVGLLRSGRHFLLQWIPGGAVVPVRTAQQRRRHVLDRRTATDGLRSASACSVTAIRRRPRTGEERLERRDFAEQDHGLAEFVSSLRVRAPATATSGQRDSWRHRSNRASAAEKIDERRRRHGRHRGRAAELVSVACAPLDIRRPRVTAKRKRGRRSIRTAHSPLYAFRGGAPAPDPHRRLGTRAVRSVSVVVSASCSPSGLVRDRGRRGDARR